MLMSEKKMISIQKEIEKLQKSLERNKGLLEKSIANCEKLGCNWSLEEMRQHNDDCTEKQHVAWFKKFGYEREVADLEKRIDRTNDRLAKATCKFETEAGQKASEDAESERSKAIESRWTAYFEKTPEQRKAEYEAWLKQFKAECLEDGIVIEEATNNFINGTTAKGKKFAMLINNGWTERSLHCYTLMIEGQTIFTSGTFETGYKIIKK